MANDDGFDIRNPLSTEELLQLDEVVKMAEDAIPTIRQAMDAGLDVGGALEQIEQSRDQAVRLIQAFKPKRTRAKR